MTQDLIRYDILAQDALRGVIRRVLKGVVQDGLPGEHHFYITFATGAPGVRLSQRMREQYPDEMTIVLQHQYWDLEVTEHQFNVGLAFNGIPERLTIPFAAITRFFDPAVQFGLEFEVERDADETDEDMADDGEVMLAENGELPADADVIVESTDTDGDSDTPEGADVVSLDAFRKKK
ncbi:MAG: hypothetical protein KDJ77_16355 [Rhodobiaceae bacterium]|nr:hypothetical protein [Rhodobiaceae bacterium]